ncbi:MFS transporter [Agrobacterium pusense]|jgi:EmrB/QacA subfamily drug resistance transporter|uniref:MFS transporter n=1 Tax=Agrobacterium pusense TaxID=648995 RepID=UPI002452C9D6|nr:MFS transporter [Agrobacterium pusense]
MPTGPHANISPDKTAILAIILISYVMIVLDISIVLTGLPRIHAELGFRDAGLAWVSTAYTLTFGGCLLLGARAGDIFGRRRMFLVGLTIFSFASLVIGMSQTPAVMIAARALQGLGSAILAPSTLALLQTNFEPGPERTRAVSYYAAAAGVSAAFGLVIGGLLADWLSWRVGFFINLPVGIAMMVAAKRYVRETQKTPGTFDIAGAIISTLGIVALVYGVIRSASTGWTDVMTGACIGLGLVMLILFAVVESRASQPIMPLSLFADRERSAAYAARALFLGANVGFYFFVAQFLQSVVGLSSSQAGIVFLPTTVMNFIIAMSTPRLIGSYGAGRVLVTSVLTGLIGMIWLSFAMQQASLAALVIPMMLIGAGQGGALGPLTASGIVRVPSERAGAASGVVNVAHQLGSSLGLGVLVAVAALGSQGLRGTALLARRASLAIETGSALIALTLILAVLFITRPHSPPETTSTTA